MANFKYKYPKPTDTGHHWHTLYKAWIVTGIRPLGKSETMTDCIIIFDQELTTQQETDLTAMMAGDPREPSFAGFQETGTQTFVVKDLFGKREWFDAWFASTGISGEAMMFFVESDPVGNPGVYDEIHIKFTKLLTNPNKNAVESAFAAAGDWQA
jgi:hypothetical protein